MVSASTTPQAVAGRPWGWFNNAVALSSLRAFLALTSARLAFCSSVNTFFTGLAFFATAFFLGLALTFGLAAFLATFFTGFLVVFAVVVLVARGLAADLVAVT